MSMPDKLVQYIDTRSLTQRHIELGYVEYMNTCVYLHTWNAVRYRHLKMHYHAKYHSCRSFRHLNLFVNTRSWWTQWWWTLSYQIYLVPKLTNTKRHGQSLPSSIYTCNCKWFWLFKRFPPLHVPWMKTLAPAGCWMFILRKACAARLTWNGRPKRAMKWWRCLVKGGG